MPPRVNTNLLTACVTKGIKMTDDILQDDGLEQEDGKKRRGRRKKSKPAGEGGGLRQWLVDSYNGVFRIVIQPQLPSLRVLSFMLIAFLAGMFWAYEPAGVQFYDGAPHQMRSEHQDQYIIGIAASKLANIYDDEGIRQLLERIDDPAERAERLIQRGGQTAAALEQVIDVARVVEGRPAPSSGSLLAAILQIAGGVLIFVVVVNVFALVWGLLIGGYVERARLTIKRRMVGESDDDKRARETMEGERRRRDIAKQMLETTTDSDRALGTPLVNKPSIYFKGRAYDDSFAIEDADDMFLGETGATVARSIGDGQDLSAVEVWLFDKDDFVKTLTKIFVSEHGYNDPATRSDLENRVDNPQTDIVVLRAGAEHIVESDNLIVKAKVADATPGTDPALPPNSHFESMTLQIQAWQKQAGATPASPPPMGAPAGGLPDVSDYQIGTLSDAPASPPPPPPPPPSSSGQRDLSEYEIDPLPPGMSPPPSPPPMGSPGTSTRPTMPPDLPPYDAGDDDDEEDDPFGGTADFTPINR